MGVDVEIHSTKGVGYDLLCRLPSRVFILEVKPPPEIGKRGKPLARNWVMTPKEERLRGAWGDDYHIVETTEDVLEVVKLYRG